MGKHGKQSGALSRGSGTPRWPQGKGFS